MSAQCVLRVWGQPDDINRTITAHGTHEQWVYRTHDTYVYIDNGMVTALQDKKGSDPGVR